MEISPLGSQSPVTRLQGSKANNAPAAGSQDVATRAAGTDTVEISDVARFLGEIKNLPDVREAKVSALRSALADGSYQETPEKLDAVVSGVLNEWA